MLPLQNLLFYWHFLQQKYLISNHNHFLWLKYMKQKNAHVIQKFYKEEVNKKKTYF